ncbi:hypothetical protein BDA96_02G246400 [Sorghum bicolor]|uniref:Uncharacterized protein n=2 Tax=Sorghum bicolor TaxID=4558 RepID=A0A921RRK2_SORBI|nr:hypothetical protein BDA96_02G246400 [Sorghum bicolor]KXG35832.1 hypothetical protein SORBI_3002G235400 [Sorghum bicolor]
MRAPQPLGYGRGCQIVPVGLIGLGPEMYEGQVRALNPHPKGAYPGLKYKEHLM